jgi:type IV pilus assembly protein PilW
MIFFRNKHKYSFKIENAGFTLVELMIALVVSGLVMAAVVSMYVAQSRSYSEQDDIANIQQDLRGALVILLAEIRLAGSDPLETNIPKIEAATSTTLGFTMDVRGSAVNPNAPDGKVADPSVNNDSDENVIYGLNGDGDGDGIVDSGTGSLGRYIGDLPNPANPILQPLAENVEALEFNYIIDDGDAGVLDNVLCNGNILTTLTPTTSQLNKICGVQVSILARAANPAQGYINTNTYTPAAGVPWDLNGAAEAGNAPNDNFRRRLVVTNIQCRNTGL